MQIQRVFRGREDYPPLLSEIHDPPDALYIRGSIPDAPMVAVVGTRRMSEYGAAVLRLLVPPVAEAGICVLSGLALGVDGLAHRLALENGGMTVAVLGSGIDDASVYPRAHLQLAQKIVGLGGALLSEYPPGTASYKSHFPARNRIVAGLAEAVLVIEAPAKSGAMITARLALESGREVYAVPGPITHPNSEGVHRLIKDGAAPVTSPEELLRLLGLEPRAKDDRRLPEDEREILKLLEDGPFSADEIARNTGRAMSETTALLTALELAGMIVPLGGGRYGL